MANIKVSEMPTATSVNNEDYLMVVQGNENKKITYENLNNNFNLLSNQITVTGADMNITTSADSQTNILNLNYNTAQLGNKLTLNTSTNEITIGSGVNYVSVSCGCCIIMSSTGTYHALMVRKNGTRVGAWAQTKGQYSPSTYGYTTLSNILIPVSEGDSISMATFCRAAGSYTVGGIYMSVKVVG